MAIGLIIIGDEILSGKRQDLHSLPSVGEAAARRHIELGVKGGPVQTEAAFAQLKAGLEGLFAPYEPVAAGPP